MIKSATILWISIMAFNCFGQCNGMTQNCDRRYDQVAYLTTHNSYNSAEEGHYWENQTFGVTQQLIDGVRAFMFDLYLQNDTVVQYHGIPGLGYRPFADDLSKIKQFLDLNPNEVVTIILESYVSSSDVDNEMINAGLMTYLHSHNPAENWWTLQQLIDSNQRLILFSDVDDAMPGQNWYHYVWQYAVETHFSVHDTSEFNHDFNRGNPANDLFIFNHFVTSPTISIGEPTKAPYVNAYNYLSNRILENYALHQKFTNFITLDFYHLGDGLEVVNALNTGDLSIDSKNLGSLIISPNPSNGVVSISHELQLQKCEFLLFDNQGQIIKTLKLTKSAETLDLSNIASGLYLYKVLDQGNVINSGKIILQ